MSTSVKILVLYSLATFSLVSFAAKPNDLSEVQSRLRTICESVLKGKGETSPIYALMGQGGSGKSHQLIELASHLEQKGQKHLLIRGSLDETAQALLAVKPEQGLIVLLDSQPMVTSGGNRAIFANGLWPFSQILIEKSYEVMIAGGRVFMAISPYELDELHKWHHYMALTNRLYILKIQ